MDLKHRLLGILFILLSIILFFFFSYWMIFSKFQEDEYSLNLIMKYDKHYCVAIPIIIPVGIIVVYNRYVHYNVFRRM